MIKKILSILTGMALVTSTTSCTKQETKSEIEPPKATSSVIEEPTQTPTATTTKETTTTKEQTTKQETTTTTTTVQEDTLTENDNYVLEQFKEMGNNIKETTDDQQLLEKGKTYFIYAIDFLFYDGAIKGVKFSDLTETAKQQLLNDIVTIDNLICKKFPNYKETISTNSSNAYNKAMEIIKAGNENIKDFSREKLGEENYNKILDINSLFWKECGDSWQEFTDIMGIGGSYVKKAFGDWYQNFKDS